MKILIDTCVWSHALRHKSPDKKIIKSISDLIQDGRVIMIGPIRQELLSGVQQKTQFDKLKKTLSAFPDLPLKTFHFEVAAEFFNICRSKGIQGSTIDFLICSVANSEKSLIYTIDKDFYRYSKYLPVKLFE